MSPCLSFSCNVSAVIHSAQRRFHSRARECDRGARMWSTIGASARCHPRALGSRRGPGSARACGPAVACGLRGCVCQPAGRVGGMEGAGLVDHRQARRPRSENPADSHCSTTPYDYRTCLQLHLLYLLPTLCTSCTVAPADALSTARRATRAGERDFAV